MGDFQKQMSEDYGESHFNAFEEPLLYFQVLFLTGQFELAFEFSFRIDRLRAHSVHMCLAMYESGLLLLPNNIQAPLITQVRKYRKHGSSSFSHTFNCVCVSLFLISNYFFIQKLPLFIALYH